MRALTIVPLLVAAAWAAQADAATFNVASGDVAGLTTAILTARDNGEADTINLAAGTYTLTSALPTLYGQITLHGAGAATTILERDANAPAFRILNYAGDPGDEISGITFRGGLAQQVSGDSESVKGGGIYAINWVRIFQCVVDSNTAVLGGGLFLQGVVTLEETVVSNNTARSGAGISEVGTTLTVLHGAIQNNTATLGGGGGIDLNNAGVLHLVESTISGNSAVNGGALAMSAVSTAFVVRSTVSGNHVSTVGGGLVLGGFAAIEGSTVTGNTAGTDGGGVAAFAVATIRNSTIAGNTASGRGGGLDGSSGDVVIESSTIADNAASGPGGGVAVAGDGSVRVLDTILANNTAGGGGPDCSGVVSSLGHNLLRTAAGCSFGGGSNLVGVDPQLGSLGANGGPTNTYAPAPTSPVIGAGASCPPLDQRGYARDAACDVGAVEAGAAPGSLPSGDAFLCYQDKPSKGATKFTAQSGISLVDAFGSSTVSATKQRNLCNPADLDGGVRADAATRLSQYQVKSSAAATKHLGIRVVNALGTLSLDAIKPELLAVPSNVGKPTAPAGPPNPGDHDVDDFQCYKAVVTKGTPKFQTGRRAILRDQSLWDGVIGQLLDRPEVLDLSKPTRICLAADRDGAGFKHAGATLVCYQATPARTSVPTVLYTGKHIPVEGLFTNDIAALQVDTSKYAELCLASTRLP